MLWWKRNFSRFLVTYHENFLRGNFKRSFVAVECIYKLGFELAFAPAILFICLVKLTFVTECVQNISASLNIPPPLAFHTHTHTHIWWLRVAQGIWWSEEVRTIRGILAVSGFGPVPWNPHSAGQLFVASAGFLGIAFFSLYRSPRQRRPAWKDPQWGETIA